MNLASAWGHSVCDGPNDSHRVSMWLDAEALSIMPERKDVVLDGIDHNTAIEIVGWWVSVCSVLSTHIACVAMDAYREGFADGVKSSGSGPPMFIEVEDDD